MLYDCKYFADRQLSPMNCTKSEVNSFHLLLRLTSNLGFPGGTVVKNPSASAGDARDTGLILALGRFPGGGYDNPPQYSWLENCMDSGTWQATVHGVPKRQTRLE